MKDLHAATDLVRYTIRIDVKPHQAERVEDLLRKITEGLAGRLGRTEYKDGGTHLSKVASHTVTGKRTLGPRGPKPGEKR